MIVVVIKIMRKCFTVSSSDVADIAERPERDVRPFLLVLSFPELREQF